MQSGEPMREELQVLGTAIDGHSSFAWAVLRLELTSTVKFMKETMYQVGIQGVC